MAMGERDVIALNVLGLVLGQRVAGEERVYTDAFARLAVFDEEAGVSEEGQIDRHDASRLRVVRCIIVFVSK